MGSINKKNELAAAKVVVSGKVQGVFYRVWARNTAKSLHIKGWVKNTKNGRVEALLEGEKKDVEEMINKCETGSKFSEVKDIRVGWVKPKDLIRFEIIY